MAALRRQSSARGPGRQTDRVSEDDVGVQPSSFAPTPVNDRSRSGSIYLLTPKDYVEAVVRHSEQTVYTNIYPGPDFEKLATYLREFLKTATTPAQTSPYVSPHAFASVYTWSLGKRAKENITTPTRLQEKCESLRRGHESCNQTVFLRGQPSSEWLATIGASHRVDPCFFQSHLDFFALAGKTNLFTLPSLSSSCNTITLPYPTLGEWKRPKAKVIQSGIEALRVESAKQMKEYTHGLVSNMNKGIGLGRSIIRRFSAYDETHFAFEQRITICLEKSPRDWSVLVWLDASKDLTYGFSDKSDDPSNPEGPWLGVKSKDEDWMPKSIYPTIQHQTHIALKSHKTGIDCKSGPTNGLIQSASLLHMDYGRSLDGKLAAIDAFYAVSELFNFCASSGAQFLNMLESKLSSSIDAAFILNQSLELSNLLYMQKDLKRYTEQLKDTIDTIKLRGGHNWPRALDEPLQRKAEATAEASQRNFELLLRRSESISARMDDEMRLLTNKAMIDEAQGALKQAKEVTKLTMLASFYIPLSFTASFFGMNLYPLVSAPQSLWVYFAFSLPVLFCSIAPLFWDIPGLFLRGWKLMKNHKADRG